jgi:hypothetical protein
MSEVIRYVKIHNAKVEVREEKRSYLEECMQLNKHFQNQTNTEFQ